MKGRSPRPRAVKYPWIVCIVSLWSAKAWDAYVEAEPLGRLGFLLVLELPHGSACRERGLTVHHTPEGSSVRHRQAGEYLAAGHVALDVSGWVRRQLDEVEGLLEAESLVFRHSVVPSPLQRAFGQRES